MLRRTYLVGLLIGLVVSIGAPDVHACLKPVFRYALERWRPDPYGQDAYRLAVLHKGPLDEETTRRIEAIVPEGSFNLLIQYFDVDKELPPGVLRDRWQADPDAARLPLGLFLAPPFLQTEEPVLWDGKLDAEGVAKLRAQIYPPVMRKLLQRLASGDTAVWILAKGADESKNKQVRRMLDESLAELEKELKLPHEQDPTDSQYDSDLLPGIPMRTSFSVVETDLNDPANRLLKASLMAGEPDSLKQPGPKIIPVFARGRAWAILFGDELRAEDIQQISYILVGPCSCRIKAQYPGFDLPAPFPWDGILYEETTLDAVMKSLPAGPQAK